MLLPCGVSLNDKIKHRTGQNRNYKRDRKRNLNITLSRKMNRNTQGDFCFH